MFGANQVVQPQFISFLGSHRVGQSVIAGLHTVSGHLRMLTVLMVIVMQQILKVCHIVSWSQGRRSTLPNTMLVGIMSVVSWVMFCRSAGRWVGSYPSISSLLKQPSSDVSQLPSYIVPPCYQTVRRGGMCLAYLQVL